MNWETILELLFKYGPDMIKLILELFNKAPADRAAASRNFAAMFLAATKQNDWKGMMLAQTCCCAMSLSDDAFANFKGGLERVASGLAATGEALQAAK
jgi:hypothetical protein